jgi:hypothetical protein
MDTASTGPTFASSASPRPSRSRPSRVPARAARRLSFPRAGRPELPQQRLPSCASAYSCSSRCRSRSDVGAAAGVELAAEANVQATSADDVGHERVAGREPAAGRASASARTSIRSLARLRRSGKSRFSITAIRRSSCRSRAPGRSGSWRPRERSRRSSSSGKSGRAADSIRWASASGTATAPGNRASA